MKAGTPIETIELEVEVMKRQERQRGYNQTGTMYVVLGVRE